MRNLFLAAVTALILGACGGVAHAACPQPNPNNNPLMNGWVDGCVAPAAGLNQMITASTKGCSLLENFGGAADGTTDNTTAWTSMVAAAPKCISFLAGTYNFNSQISYTLPSNSPGVTITGQGMEATQLTWPNAAGGMKIIRSSLSQPVNISNFAYTTGQAGGGNALELTTNINPVSVPNWDQSVLKSLIFRGSDGLAVTNYWNRGLYIHNSGQISCDGCSFWGAQTGSVGGYAGNGIGIDIEGDATHLVTVFNISNYVGMYLASCWTYGNNAQGVTIQYSNCTGGTNGLAMNGGTGQFQLNMNNNQINVSGTAVGITTQLNTADIYDNLILLPNNSAVGILLDPSEYDQIHHNAIQGLGSTHGTAINVNSQVTSYSHIDNNLISATVTGVKIANGVALVALTDNQYFGVTTPINNLNTSYLRALVVDSPLDCTSTMQVLFGSSPETLTTPYCKYINNSNNLTVSMGIIFNGAVPSGTATIAGLPIQTGLSSGTSNCQMTNYSNMASVTSPNPYIVPGTTSVVLAQNGTGSTTNLTNSNFMSNTMFNLICSIPLLP